MTNGPISSIRMTTRERNDGDTLYIDPAESAIEEGYSVSHSRFAESENDQYIASIVRRDWNSTQTELVALFKEESYVAELPIPIGDGVRNVAVTNNGRVYLYADYDETSTHTTDQLPTPDQEESPSNLLMAWESNLESPDYIDAFVSEMQWIAVSGNGAYVSALTGLPDRSAHLYTGDGQYIGKAEMPGPAIHCRFEKQDGHHYIIGYGPNLEEPREYAVDGEKFANSTHQVHNPVVVPNEESSGHIIAEESIPDDTQRLRLPGISLNSTCGEPVTPIDANRIYDDVSTAVDSGVTLCSSCESGSAEPEKYEQTSYVNR